MQSDWFERVPKAELHLHLEGAIPHAALWELIEKYGGDPEVPDRKCLERKFQYQNIAHFLDTWRWKNRFLREYDDFSFIAEAVAENLARQNIRYVEAFFSLPDFVRRGLSPGRLTEAVRAGLSRVPQIEIALVIDLIRNFGPEEAERTLDHVTEARGLGVIGIGLGGAEAQYPPEPFLRVFARAQRLGFHASAHAGEAAGPESVWGALRALRVERIGHGTRAVEDPALLDHLAECRIPLEMCPLSNVGTRVVPSLEAHPIKRCFHRGISITVNTDDPAMFGNTLAGEYSLLETSLGFSRDEIRTLILNGIRFSWLPEEKKQAYLEAFQRDPAWKEPDPA